MSSRKLRWACGGGVVVLLLASVLIVLKRQSEPQYQGKRVSEWIRDYAPVLVGASLVTNIYSTKTPQAVLRGLSSSAVSIIGVGPRSPTGVFNVTNVLTLGGTTTYPARDALRAIGPAALPYLKEALQTQDTFWDLKYRKWFPKIRRVLGKRAPNPSLPAQMVRTRAALAIGQLRLEGAATNLVWALGDSNLEVRQQVRNSLKRLRWREDPIATAFEEFLRQEKRIEIAMETIAEMKLPGPVTMAVLCDALRSQPPVQWQAVQALIYLGSDGQDALPILIPLIRSAGNQQLTEGALRAVEAMGPAAAVAVPALNEALDSPNAESRYLATRALASMMPDVVAARAALEKAMQNENDMVRTVAGRALYKGQEAAAREQEESSKSQGPNSK